MSRSMATGNRRRTGGRSYGQMAGPGVEERLVYAETVDDLILKGALLRPAPATAPPDLLLIWVHTRQQGFADLEYVRIGRLLTAKGYHFLTIDTRGHDFGAWYRTPGGPTLHGSAWEHFSDCVHDIDAWVGVARNLGYRRIVLIGHGFGGAKCLHYQAQRQVPEIAAVVLASSGSAVRDKLPPHLSDLAETMVAEGHGLDLLPWGTGENYASTVSADYYVARSVLSKEMYGSPDLPPAIARVRCPVIAWFGAQEDRPTRRVAEFLDWLAANAVVSEHVDCAILDGIDFFYSGKEEVVVAHLSRALETIGLSADRSVQPA